MTAAEVSEIRANALDAAMDALARAHADAVAAIAATPDGQAALVGATRAVEALEALKIGCMWPIRAFLLVYTEGQGQRPVCFGYIKSRECLLRHKRDNVC
jgi:hypothetical protein